MEKITSIILTRDDLKQTFQDVPFGKVNPYHFSDKAIRNFNKYPVVIFVNKCIMNDINDKRSRVLKNDFGLWGWIIPSNKL
jgi:hypothetical protein